MNKILKGTAVSAAALLVASAGANAASLKVGGYMDMKFSAQSNDAAYENQGTAKDYVNFDVRNDSEIHFKGSAKLDNGVKIGTKIELEGFSVNDAGDAGSLAASGNQSADYIDEAFMTIKGSFGTIKIGSADLAPKTTTTIHQATFMMNAGENTRFNVTKLIAKPSDVSGSGIGQMDLSSDAEGISWFSPRMNGFQLSLGYAATSNEDYDGLKRETDANHNILAGALNWSGKMGGTKVSVAAGYTTASSSTAANSDPNQTVVGVRIHSGAVSFGMSYQDNSNSAAAGSHAGETIFEAGVKYSMGPNAISFVIADNQYDSNAAATKDDSISMGSIAFARTLAKGVKWHNTIHFANFDNGANAAAASTSNDGYAFTTGLKVSF